MTVFDSVRIKDLLCLTVDIITNCNMLPEPLLSCDEYMIRNSFLGSWCPRDKETNGKGQEMPQINRQR